MGHINLMDGLSLLHQWTDNCVKSGNLFFADTQAAAGFRYGFIRFGVGMLCIVVLRTSLEIVVGFLYNLRAISLKD